MNSKKFHFEDCLDNFIQTATAYPSDITILQNTVLYKNDLINCANLLGGLYPSTFGDIRLVKYDPTVTNSTASSLKPLQLHTDGAFLEKPPNKFILSFIQEDQNSGGVSTFVFLEDILKKMPTSVFDALSNSNYLFPRTYDNYTVDSFTGSILSRDSDGKISIRWRADKIYKPNVVNPHGSDAEEAIDWLYNFLETFTPVTYTAKKGDTLLIPNTTVLHGRTLLSPDSHREVFRIWVK